MFARSDTVVQVFLHGTERVEITELVSRKNFLEARVRSMPMQSEQGIESEAMEREVLDLAKRYFTLAQPNLDLNIPQVIPSGEAFSQIIYPLGQLLSMPMDRRQAFQPRSAERPDGSGPRPLWLKGY